MDIRARQALLQPKPFFTLLFPLLSTLTCQCSYELTKVAFLAVSAAATTWALDSSISLKWVSNVPCSLSSPVVSASSLLIGPGHPCSPLRTPPWPIPCFLSLYSDITTVVGSFQKSPHSGIFLHDTLLHLNHMFYLFCSFSFLGMSAPWLKFFFGCWVFFCVLQYQSNV